MRTIGLIGGMSWESTANYYRAINQAVKQRLGGLHSAKIVMVSVDFEEIEQYQRADEWEKAGDVLAQAAVSLQSAGADFFLICTNTMHKVADRVQRAVHIPLLHIADATAQVIKEQGFKSVGLLGTAFTMEQDFYKGRLESRYELNVLVPNSPSRKIVHTVIYDELCLGVVKDTSKAQYAEIISQLAANGAQAVILGCTEIAMLIASSDVNLPLLDTTHIHALAAVDKAL